MGKSETEAMRNKLVDDGLGSYLDALTAVREFQKAIIERSRKALEEKLKDLSKAMGISVKREDIKDYTYPSELTNKELGVYEYVGIKFSRELMSYCIFGLYFERKDSKCVTEVFVIMCPDKAPPRDFLLKHCKKVSPNFYNDYWNEIGLDITIGKDEMNNFEAKLQELIDKWIEVWESIGGIKKLPK